MLRELIGQDGENIDALAVHAGLADGGPVVQVPLLAEIHIGIGLGPQSEAVEFDHPVSDVGIEAHGNGAGLLIAARSHPEESERGTETGREVFFESPSEVGRDAEVELVLVRAGIREVAVGSGEVEAAADIWFLGIGHEAGQRKDGGEDKFE